MPLFMLISGYLFAFTVKNLFSNDDVKTIIVKKVNQLIIPLLSWSFVSVAIQIGELTLKGIASQISVIWLLKQLVSNFVLGPWFLWAIWWCSLVVIFVKYFFKDNLYIYFTVLVLTLFVPDSYGLALYKFMYPYFLLGYWFNTYNFKEKLKKVYGNKLSAIAVIILYFMLLRLYNRHTYIYTTGYTLLGKDLFEQLGIDCYRFLVGVFGSVSLMFAILFVFRFCKEKDMHWLVYVGKNTLGIYVISGILFSNGLQRIMSGVDGINYLLTFTECIVILLISLAINWLLHKNKVLNALLLGGR